MGKEEFFSQFSIEGESQAKLKVEDSEPTSDDEDKKPSSTFFVYEVWSRKDKKVSFLCEEWEDILVEENEDSMNLQGFFPTPGLLLMTGKASRLIPTPLYSYYRNQAEELNRVTARLNKVLSALKVRGAYNTLLGEDLASILASEETENALVPAKESSAMLAQQGGFEKHIWLLPLDQLAKVAAELYRARESIKQVIYEITGISDIIRGSSIASETATAQNLKNKWGSIRLRDMQKSVASYVRDLYRMTIDAGVALVPPEQWKAITSTSLLLNNEKQAAIQQLTYAKALQRPIPPEAEKAIQAPSLEETLQKLNSDAFRSYTINVQSDSTVDLDTATDKQEVTEFMNSMGQLMAGLQPLASLGPSGLEAAKAVTIAVCQRFKFGLAIVDQLKAIQAPPPPKPEGPTPEQLQKEQDMGLQAADLAKQAGELKALQAQLEGQKALLQEMVKSWEQVRSAQTEALQAKAESLSSQAEAAAARAEATASKAGAQATEKQAQAVSATNGMRTAQKTVQASTQQLQPVLQQLGTGMQQMASGLQEIQAAISDLTKAVNRPRVPVRDAKGKAIAGRPATDEEITAMTSQ